MKFSSVKLVFVTIKAVSVGKHPEADPRAGTQNCAKVAKSTTLACLHPITSSRKQEHDSGDSIPIQTAQANL